VRFFSSLDRRPLLAWQLTQEKVVPGACTRPGITAFMGLPEGRMAFRYIFSPSDSVCSSVFQEMSFRPAHILLGDAVKMPRKRMQAMVGPIRHVSMHRPFTLFPWLAP
jgi:hypothetical protein